MSIRRMTEAAKQVLAEAAARSRSLLRATHDTPSRHLDLLQLEDRVLLSATPAAVVLESADVADAMLAAYADSATMDSSTPAAPDTQAAETSASTDAATNIGSTADGEQNEEQHRQPEAASDRHEVVIVDAVTARADGILDDLYAQQSAGRDLRIFVLDADLDGVEQITDILAGQSQVDALHIVSHGTTGAIKLGSTWLQIDSLDAHAGSISLWGNSLSLDGDILFYGCDLAGSLEGQMLAEAVSTLTGADVAASTDDTGSERLGGNWDLEFRTGEITAEVAASAELQASWDGLLNTFVVTTTSNTNSGSLREAIINANSLPGLDTITFNITGGGAKTISITTALPDITDAVIIDGTTQPGYAGVPLVELDGNGAGTIDGLRILTNNVTVRGLAISKFGGNGIYIAGDNNVVAGTYIGVGLTGGGSVGVGQLGIRIDNGSNNQIGGTAANDRNVIARSGFAGIAVRGAGSDGNVIVGNIIGLNASGTLALGNTHYGIDLWNGGSGSGPTNTVIGGTTAAERNVISGNGWAGIHIGNGGNGTLIQGNYIGTDITGTSGFGNGASGSNAAGILINTDSSSNTVGGTVPGAGNLIAFNSGAGVRIDGIASDGNSVRGNRIHSNASLGIDLGTSGVSVNDTGDADSGANNQQNFPVLNTAESRAAGLTVDGTLNSTASSTVTVDIYANTVLDASGYGEAQRWLGAFLVETDGSGNVAFQRLLNQASVAAGEFITATATDASGNTSELSAGLAAVVIPELAPTGERSVNQTTSGVQATSASTRGSEQAVAIDAAGNYVVVWSSNQSGGIDGDGYGVMARLFNASGTALTGEFLVNQTTSDDQKWARVARADDGSFVVTWTSGASGSENVFFRRFAANGAALGNEVMVNTTTTGSQKNATISMNRTTGGFVIAWEGQGSADTAGIYYRRFNADGSAVNGAELRANVNDRGTETRPVVSMNRSGAFIIGWDVGGSVYIQRFTNAGTSIAGEEQLPDTASASRLAVALNETGSYVVVARSDFILAPGTYVRAFSAAGTPVTSWTAVALGDRTSPSISMDAAGNYAVVYQGSVDGSGQGIRARIYAADHSVIRTIDVNHETVGDQTQPSVALLNKDNLVFAWSGSGEGDADGVYARQFGTAAEAFVAESATTINVDGTIEAAWSAADTHEITLLTPGSVITNASDLSGRWRALWDSTYLYVMAEARDETIVGDSASAFDDDVVELYIDAAFSQESTYHGEVYQLGLKIADGTLQTGTNSVTDTTGILRAVTTTGTGYSVEFAVPWSLLGVTPSGGNLIGVEVQLGDDDNGGARDGKLAWTDGTDQAWTNPTVFGSAILTGATNSAPSSIPGSGYSINAGDSVNLDGSTSFDPDLDSLTYQWDLDNDGIYGEAGEPTTATATVTWSTLQSFGITGSGVYTIGLRVDDGKGGVDTATTTLDVNAPPVAVADSYSVIEDGILTATSGVLSNDTDAENDPLTAALVSTTSNGVLSFNANGTFTYTPNSNFNGTDNFTYRATDGSANSAIATVTITVSSVNDTPVANAGGPYSLAEGGTVTLNGNGSSDIDGNSLTYAWDLNNDGTFGDVTGASPTVAWSTLQSFGIADNGTFTIGLRVNDGNGGLNAATAVLTVSNTAPTLSASGATTVVAGTPYTLNLSATDPGADTITNWIINWGDGSIQTVAGNPSLVTHTYANTGFTNNILVSATDEDGTYFQNELLTPDFSRNSVFRFTGTSGAFAQEFANGQTLNDPIAAVIGPDGNLYVSGELSKDVLRYNAATGAFIDTFIAAGSGGMKSAEGLAFGADGNLYVADYDDNSVRRFNGTTGAFIDKFVASSSGGLSTPYGIAFGPDGNLYVASYTGNRVLRFNGTTGAFIGIFVSAGSGGLNTPEAITFGPAGNLYVASHATDSVLRYNGSTGAFLGAFIPAGTGGLDNPTGLAFGPDGNLYVGDYADGAILRFNGSSGAFIDEYVAAGSGSLAQPVFISFTPSEQVTVTAANAPPTDITLSSASVNEGTNTTGGHSVGTLTASDPDTGETFLWSIAGGADAAKFSLGGAANNVLVLTDGVLDYETGPHSYAVDVRATDSGGNHFVKTLTVAVNDLNDEVPVVDSGLSFSVSELATNGTVVGTVTATDADAGTTFSNWTITGGNTDNIFGINSATGVISVVNNTLLDFETTTSYLLSITVSDGVRTSAVETVSVDVLNASDNAPTATDDSYTVNEGGTLTVSGTPNWFNANWDVRQRLTIDNSARSTALTSYPVLVKLHASAVDAITIDYSQTRDAGQDLRFVDGDGMVLAHQIERWDEAGYSYAWVNVPVVDAASASDFIWMYYGNAVAADGQNATAVWNSGERAVLHLNEFTDDSTSFANDGIVSNAFTGPGIVAGAALFDGSASAVIIPSDASVDDIFSGGGSVSAWINPDGWGENGFGRIADKASTTFATNGNGWTLQVAGSGSSGYILFQQGYTGSIGEWRTSTGTLSLATWQHIVVSFDNSSASNSPKVFIDGVEQAVTRVVAPSGTARSDAGINLVIGNYAQSSIRTFDGRIDEFRYSSELATADEVSADVAAVTGALVSSTLTETGPIGLMNNDLDSDSDAISVLVITSGPAHASSFTWNADGTFSYQHDGSETTTDSFTYRISDGTGGFDTATVNISITPQNDTPTAISLSNSTVAESVFGATVGTMTTSDPDIGDSHTYSVNDARFEIVGGVLRLKAGNELDFETEVSVTLTITTTDSSSSAFDQLFTINVVDVNDEVPVVTPGQSFAIDEDSANGVVVGTVAATDADAGTTFGNWTITSGNTGGAFAINAATGQITILNANAIDFETATSFTLGVRVSDGSNTSAVETVTITINDINDEVPVAGDDAYTVTEGGLLSVPAASGVQANDSDADVGGTLSVSVVSGPAHAAAFTLNADGSFSYRHDGSESTSDSFVYRLSDGINVATATVTLSITPQNGAPTDITLSAATVAENHRGATIGTLTTTDADSGDTHTYVVDDARFEVVGNTLKLKAGLSLDYESESTVPLSITSTDSVGASIARGFTISVIDRNELPGLSVTPVVTTLAEGTETSLPITVATLAVSDDALGSNTLSLSGADAALFEISGMELRLKAGTVLDFETSSALNVTVELDDAAIGSTPDDSASFTLSVTNRGPVARNDAGAGFTTSEDTAFISANVLANDSDPADGSLSVLSINTAGTLGSVIDQGNGTFLYDPNGQFESLAPGSTASDSFTYTVTDGTSTRTATVTITVTGSNDAPNAAGFTVSINENSVAGVVAGTVTGSDADAGDSVTWAITGGNTGNAFNIDPATGVIRVANRQALDFETTPSFSLNIAATDTHGMTTLATARVQLNDRNEAPLLAAAGFTVLENSPVGTIVGTLSATDPDAADTLVWRIVSGNSGGAFQLDASTGLLTVASAAAIDFETTPSFTLLVEVADAGGLTDQIQVAVQVTDRNERPLVLGLSDILLNEDSAPVTIDLAAGFIDAETASGDLAYTVTTSTTAMMESVRTSGSSLLLAFAPDASGSVIVTVQATDTQGASAVTSFMVTLQPVNDAPVAVTDTYTMSTSRIGVTAAQGVLSNDHDVDSTTLTARLATAPEHGVVTLQADGSFAYATIGNFSGFDQFTYVVSDGDGSQRTGTVRLTVVAAVPVAAPAPAAPTESAATTADSSSTESTSTSESDSDSTASTKSSDGDSSSSSTSENSQSAGAAPGPGAVTGTGAAGSGTVDVLPGGSSSSDSSVNEDELSGPQFNNTASLLAAPDGDAARDDQSSSNGSDSGGLRSLLQGGNSGSSSQSLLDGLRVDGEDFTYLVTSGFVDELDKAEDEAVFDTVLPEWAVGSAVATGAGLSVGYIVWMIRGGYVLASVLSTMPMWQNIDPLPVLSALDGANDEDDESLEAMIDRVEGDAVADDLDSPDSEQVAMSGETGLTDVGQSDDLGPDTSDRAGVNEAEPAAAEINA